MLQVLHTENQKIHIVMNQRVNKDFEKFKL